MKPSTLLGTVLAVLCVAVCATSRAFAEPFKNNEVICAGFTVIPEPIPGCGDSDPICAQDSMCKPWEFSPHCLRPSTGETIGIARVCQGNDTSFDRMWILTNEPPGLCEPGTHVVCGVSYTLGLSIAPETLAFEGRTTVPFDPKQRNIMVFCACATR